MQDVINEAKQDLACIFDKSPVTRSALIVATLFGIGGLLPIAGPGYNFTLLGMFDLVGYNGWWPKYTFLGAGFAAIAAAWFADRQPSFVRKLFLYGGAALFVFCAFQIHKVGVAAIESDIETCNKVMIFGSGDGLFGGMLNALVSMVGSDTQEIADMVNLCKEKFGEGKTQVYLPGLGGFAWLAGASILMRAGGKIGKY